MLACIALTGGSGRISAGDSYDTNDLAYVLVTCLPIAYGFGSVSRGRSRLLFYCVATLLLFATLLTQSRGGLLGLVGATIFLIIRPLGGKTRRPWKFIAIASIVATIGAGTVALLPTETIERFATLGDLKSDYNMDANNVSGRTSIWRRGAISAIHRPIGFGPNTFNHVDFMTGGTFKAPHNSLLQISVEFGWLGLLLYLLVHIRAWQHLQVDSIPEAAPISRSIKSALLANFVAAFFLSQAYSGILWCILALSANMRELNPPPQNHRSN
jgi:O-antigen ligase